MQIQVKLDDTRPARIIDSYTDKERRTFAMVLQLFKNKSKQAMLLFELVETLAYRKLKEDVEPKQVTMEQHERLSRYIPWEYAKTKLWKGRWNPTTYSQLKKHFEAIAKILEGIE